MADGAFGGGSRQGNFFIGNRLRLNIQSANPTSTTLGGLPDSSHVDIFSKSDGIYYINSAGTVVKLNDAATASAGSFTTLAVSGAATFATTVGITGAVTLASTLAVTGAITPTGGIAAAGGFAVRPRNIHTGGIPARVNTDGTDATPVATEVYIGEIYIPANCSVTGVSIFNGSVASGNVKVGLADSAGNVVATSASTAMSGTDSYQRVPFTTAYSAKGGATYFVLLFVDNNTARINTHTFGDFGAAKQTGQVFATGFTAITPPTTFTTALAPIASLY